MLRPFALFIIPFRFSITNMSPRSILKIMICQRHIGAGTGIHFWYSPLKIGNNICVAVVFVNRNVYLENTILGFIMEDNTFFTSYCLPYRMFLLPGMSFRLLSLMVFPPPSSLFIGQTDQMHFTWDTITFDQRLAGNVPHEGMYFCKVLICLNTFCVVTFYDCIL